MRNVAFDGLTRALAAPRSRRAVLAGLGALALRTAPTRAAAPTGFTAVEIKVSAKYTGASANAINASGAAVGFATTTDAATGQVDAHPLYFQKKAQLLGGKGASGSALAINDLGHIAGLMIKQGETTTTRPVLWTTKGATDLGSLGGSGIATAINHADQVVGSSALPAEQGSISHAYLWAKGKMTDLGALVDGAASTASDINDAGLIVGGSGTTAGGTTFDAGAHAVFWKKGKITDLGVLPGGEMSLAVSVNASGQIVGASTTGAGQTYAGAGTQPFLWSKGVMTALPMPDGSSACLAGAINKQGWITGICAAPGSDSVVGSSFAVLWMDGTLFDLTALTGGGWTIQRAYGLNDVGQIACGALAADGSSHALILTPTAA